MDDLALEDAPVRVDDGQIDARAARADASVVRVPSRIRSSEASAAMISPEAKVQPIRLPMP